MTCSLLTRSTAALDVIIGKGPGAKSLRLKLPHFTLIGATTRFALLSPPLRDRFGSVYRLDFYQEAAIKSILERSARILEIKAEGGGLQEVARRARGTPRGQPPAEAGAGLRPGHG